VRFKNHMRESITNLLSAKLRSFLAILGVLVGTASVVALVSGGQLATEHALAQFKRLGTDLLAVTIQDSGRDESSSEQQKITLDEVPHFARFADGIKDVTAYSVDYAQINFDSHPLRGNVVGVAEKLKSIFKLHISKGRFISDYDNEQRYVVVGYELAKRIAAFTSDSSGALGQQLLVGGKYYTVVGSLAKSPDSFFFMVDINNAAFLPVNAALTNNQYAELNNFVFRIKKDADVVKVQDQLKKQLVEMYPKKRMYFRSPQEIIDSMKKQTTTFTLLLGFIGSIALVVGGIGVMNIMLVSVVERRREIGIRMAVGAKRRDIQRMFLTESVALTLFGGLIGVLFGEAVAFITAHFSGWEFHLYLLPPIIGFLVSAMVGIFFGFYPAYKAARLDPIETLRAD